MARKRGRSLNDGKTWKCRRCGAVNKPTKHRFFNLPAFNCSGCPRKLKLDFKFCLGEIKVKGKSLIGEVLDQGKEGLCVPYAYAKAAEITERVSNVKNRVDPDTVVPFDPCHLEQRFGDKFPNVPSADSITRNVGLHRVLHMGLILKMEGIDRVRPGEQYRAADVSTIPRNSFEKICQSLAEGVPFVATYLAGKRRNRMRYCQIYKSPSEKRIEDKKAPRLGHAVVLIGAGMKKGKRYFYFLSSWGNKFCPRKNKKGETVKGGIGKLRVKDLTKNVVSLSHQGEIGKRSLLEQSEFKISGFNYILMMELEDQGCAEKLERLRVTALNSGYVQSDHVEDGVFCDDQGGLHGSDAVRVHDGKELTKPDPTHPAVQLIEQDLVVPKEEDAQPLPSTNRKKAAGEVAFEVYSRRSWGLGTRQLMFRPRNQKPREQGD
ncbi:hypothetical protein ACP70R_049632 [Stipagrostis hirtigluma subsp. patula]